MKTLRLANLRREFHKASTLNRLDDCIELILRYLPMPLPELALRLGVSEQQIRDRLKASRGQRGLKGTNRFFLYDGRVHIMVEKVDTILVQ